MAIMGCSCLPQHLPCFKKKNKKLFKMCLDKWGDVWEFEGMNVWRCERKMSRKWECLDWGMLR